MKRIDPVELSGLIDGELPFPRAEEVRGALAAEPGLAASFERLAGLDSEWKGCAAGLAFQPRVSLSRALRRRFLRAAALTLGLLGLRLGLKPALPLLEIVVALAVFALVVGWGLRDLLRTSEEDCWWLLRRPVTPMA